MRVVLTEERKFNVKGGGGAGRSKPKESVILWGFDLFLLTPLVMAREQCGKMSDCASP